MQYTPKMDWCWGPTLSIRQSIVAAGFDPDILPQSVDMDVARESEALA